jgi:hypothetical protein
VRRGEKFIEVIPDLPSLLSWLQVLEEDPRQERSTRNIQLEATMEAACAQPNADSE